MSSQCNSVFCLASSTILLLARKALKDSLMRYLGYFFGEVQQIKTKRGAANVFFSVTPTILNKYLTFSCGYAKSTQIKIVNRLFIAKLSNSSWSVLKNPIGVLQVSWYFNVEYYWPLCKVYWSGFCKLSSCTPGFLLN